MIRLLIFVLCFSSLAFTDEEKPPEFRASCRKKIHGAFRIDEFDGWKIVSNDMLSTLDGVSISHKSDADLPAWLPDNYKKKGIRKGVLKLPTRNNWLVCHHSKMKVVIEREIPDGLSACTVSEKADAINIVCR